MMARVWLFYTGFYQKPDSTTSRDGGSVSKQEVITMLGECINSSGHTLVGDFHELWPYTNELTIQDYPYIKLYGQNWQDIEIYASDNGASQPQRHFLRCSSLTLQTGMCAGVATKYQLYSHCVDCNHWPTPILFCRWLGPGQLDSEGSRGSMAGR